MNPSGIAVFYGGFSEAVCVAEIRPHVSGFVVVGQFQTTRRFRLLDLTLVGQRWFPGSMFQSNYYERATKRRFLLSFHSLISRPVQPHEEAIKYVPTQVVAEYISNILGLDGIIYDAARSSRTAFASSRIRDWAWSSNGRFRAQISRYARPDPLSTSYAQDANSRPWTTTEKRPDCPPARWYAGAREGPGGPLTLFDVFDVAPGIRAIDAVSTAAGCFIAPMTVAVSYEVIARYAHSRRGASSRARPREAMAPLFVNERRFLLVAIRRRRSECGRGSCRRG
jgi:hypothetical protein